MLLKARMTSSGMTMTMQPPTSPPPPNVPVPLAVPEKAQDTDDIQNTPKSASALPLRTSALKASTTTSPHESEGSYDLVEAGGDDRSKDESDEDSDWE